MTHYYNKCTYPAVLVFTGKCPHTQKHSIIIKAHIKTILLKQRHKEAYILFQSIKFLENNNPSQVPV